jgi:hypothetical protein
MKAHVILPNARRIARKAMQPSCDLPRLALFLELFVERPSQTRALK